MRRLNRALLPTMLSLACTPSPASHDDATTSTTSAGSSLGDAADTLGSSGVGSGSSGDADDGSSDGGSSDGGPTGCALTDATSLALPSGMAVHHKDGQTFVQWRDRAEGSEGQDLRYRVYRSTLPITGDDELAGLEPIATGVLNHSGQLFGSAFVPAQRLDATLPMAVIEDEGEPLPPWSGLWVATAPADECAWYAVVATDLEDNAIESVAAGVNATAEPIAERVAARRPIKVYDSSARGKYTPNTEITGAQGLPLHVTLHGSQAQGGGAGDYGDYWLYFGDDDMGWQAGLPGVFSVEETHSGPQYLLMRNRDAIVAPSGASGVETMWFGYVAEPGGVRHAYPFTEQRLAWMIPWVLTRYGVDVERVYLGGGSMGAWGTITFGLHRPELFAALFPDRPRFRQTSLTSVTTAALPDDTLPDGTVWSEHHDAIAFALAHHEDLPFVGWNCGRQDGFATWQEQIDMVAAMTASHHGFAFAWNDGDHSGGSAASATIAAWYPAERFARSASYPAFGHSSIDDELGDGDPTSGDLEGGINLGFTWTDPLDEPDQWSIAIGNALATGVMTVDVTPRRAQQFSAAAGEQLSYTSSRGGGGVVVADADGLVTVPQLEIAVGEATTLTIMRQ